MMVLKGKGRGIAAALSLALLVLADTPGASAGVRANGLLSTAGALQAPTAPLQGGTAGSATVSYGVYASVAASSSMLALYYVPITLTNGQKSPTPSPLPVMITPDPSLYAAQEASDLGNVRFCSDTACGSPLFSWLEGCGSSAPYGACSVASASAAFWVKLGPSIPGAGGTATIYMVFLSKSTDFDGVQAGEAPTLSGTYAQFDNGASVFLFYDNFAGSAIKAAWNVAGASGTYSVNDGLTVDSYSFPGYSFSLNSQYTGPLVADSYGVGTNGAWLGVSLSNLQTTSTSYAVTSGAVQWAYPPQGEDGIHGLCVSSGCTGFTPNPQTTTSQVVTLAVNSTTAAESQDYAATVVASGSNPLTDYPGLVEVGWSSSDTQTTHWFRLRAYPPGDAMPSASFGIPVESAILFLTNSGSTSLEANLAVVSTANPSRLLNLTIWFQSPFSRQVALGSGVPNLTVGPQVTLVAGRTLAVAMSVSVSSAGTSTVVLGLEIQVPGGWGATPYSGDVVILTVN
ncbi:MAG: hypothetical protein JRN08_03090 [Nitrososphaerota archaeon]|nr:hypothetical protein [Nitrososphaerota archaeon]